MKLTLSDDIMTVLWAELSVTHRLELMVEIKDFKHTQQERNIASKYPWDKLCSMYPILGKNIRKSLSIIITIDKRGQKESRKK